MPDKFFTQKTCDRCHRPLGSTRIMSMYNTDCICMDCHNKETQRDDYETARKADIDAIKSGNYNFPGIGFNDK